QQEHCGAVRHDGLLRRRPPLKKADKNGGLLWWSPIFWDYFLTMLWKIFQRFCRKTAAPKASATERPAPVAPNRSKPEPPPMRSTNGALTEAIASSSYSRTPRRES